MNWDQLTWWCQSHLQLAICGCTSLARKWQLQDNLQVQATAADVTRQNIADVQLNSKAAAAAAAKQPAPHHCVNMSRPDLPGAPCACKHQLFLTLLAIANCKAVPSASMPTASVPCNSSRRCPTRAPSAVAALPGRRAGLHTLCRMPQCSRLSAAAVPQDLPPCSSP